MEHAIESLDISNSPDLVRVAEDVRRSNTPRVLRRGDEDVAIIVPLAIAKPPRGKSAKPQADYEACFAAAGGWKDVDIEAFKAYIRERRDAPGRPPVMLDVPD